MEISKNLLREMLADEQATISEKWGGTVVQNLSGGLLAVISETQACMVTTQYQEFARLRPARRENISRIIFSYALQPIEKRR